MFWIILFICLAVTALLLYLLVPYSLWHCFYQSRYTLIYFGKFFAISVMGYLVFYQFNPLVLTVKNVMVGVGNGGILVVHALLLFITVITFYRAVKPVYYVVRVHAYNCDIIESDSVTVFDGEPGAGKSLTMTYSAGILSEHVAGKQRFKYLLQLDYETDAPAAGLYSDKTKPFIRPFATYDDYWRWATIRDAEEFYEKHPEQIPYLISNYSIWRETEHGKLFCGKLEPKKHFLQKQRLPEGAVLVGDEIADELSNQRSTAQGLQGMTDEEKRVFREQNEKYNQTFSKVRHYGDFCVFFAEQDGGEIFIGVRRVVKTNRYLEQLKKVCRPAFLLWRVARIQRKVLKHDYCTNRQWLKFFKLQKRISRIGFFRIDYSLTGSNVRSTKVKGTGSLVIPFNQPYKYETRAYFYEYEALPKPLRIKAHTSHYVNMSD